MRNPTPETTRAITAASWSKRKANEAEKAPEAIKGPKVFAIAASAAPPPANRRNPATDRTSEAPTAAEARIETILRGDRPPNKRRARAPAPGMSGMSQKRSAMLSLEVLEV